MNQHHLITALTPELYCSNMTLSLSFYIDILGFNIQYQREEDGFAMLERQGARIMLEEFTTESARTWISATLERPYGRGINFEIKTDHVDELYQRVLSANAPVFLPMEDKWYRANEVLLGNRQFIALDPDGYMLRFSEEFARQLIRDKND